MSAQQALACRVPCTGAMIVVCGSDFGDHISLALKQEDVELTGKGWSRFQHIDCSEAASGAVLWRNSILVLSGERQS